MYTLDINYYKKEVYRYLLISLFFLILGIIYEHFSLGVYSNYMIYAFMIPLVMGSLVSGIIYVLDLKILPNRISNNFYRASIITLTVGSVIKGVLDIYGTTNNLISYYLIAGIILVIISILIHIKEVIKTK